MEVWKCGISLPSCCSFDLFLFEASSNNEFKVDVSSFLQLMQTSAFGKSASRQFGLCKRDSEWTELITQARSYCS